MLWRGDGDRKDSDAVDALQRPPFAPTAASEVAHAASRPPGCWLRGCGPPRPGSARAARCGRVRDLGPDSGSGCITSHVASPTKVGEMGGGVPDSPERSGPRPIGHTASARARSPRARQGRNPNLVTTPRLPLPRCRLTPVPGGLQRSRTMLRPSLPPRRLRCRSLSDGYGLWVQRTTLSPVEGLAGSPPAMAREHRYAQRRRGGERRHNRADRPRTAEAATSPSTLRPAKPRIAAPRGGREGLPRPERVGR
jgi:hypothetical protein